MEKYTRETNGQFAETPSTGKTRVPTASDSSVTTRPSAVLGAGAAGKPTFVLSEVHAKYQEMFLGQNPTAGYQAFRSSLNMNDRNTVEAGQSEYVEALVRRADSAGANPDVTRDAADAISTALRAYENSPARDDRMDDQWAQVEYALSELGVPGEQASDLAYQMLGDRVCFRPGGSL
jgi:hypothetical protein